MRVTLWRLRRWEPGYPATLQLRDELIRPRPVDGDMRQLEVLLQVLAGALAILDLIRCRIQLYGHVLVSFQAAAALLEHDTVKNSAEVPVVELEPKEEKGGIGQ